MIILHLFACIIILISSFGAITSSMNASIQLNFLIFTAILLFIGISFDIFYYIKTNEKKID